MSLPVSTGGNRVRTSFCKGFTLVELLVVVGIIAVLMAMLMPALRRAREAANLAACLSNLRQIGTASVMHANEHRGYYPFAGWIQVNGVDATPDGMGDISQRKYSYYRALTPLPVRMRPLPYMGAVALYMGYKLNLDDEALLVAQLKDPKGVRRHFTCPSQGDQPLLGRSTGSTSWFGPMLYQDYCFNEGLLGHPYPGTPRLMGHVVKIRRPSEVVVMADGQPNEHGAPLWWTHSTGPITLADAYLSHWNAGLRSNFVVQRHDGRMNCLFVDGHAETLLIKRNNSTSAGDLDRIFLQQP